MEDFVSLFLLKFLLDSFVFSHTSSHRIFLLSAVEKISCVISSSVYWVA